jgi:hypothetical protein
MPTDAQRHWERVYQTTKPTEVSWYQPEAQLSLELIRRVAPGGSVIVASFASEGAGAVQRS